MSNCDQKILHEKQIAFNKNQQNFEFCYINNDNVRVLFLLENKCKFKIDCLDDIWSGEVCLFSFCQFDKPESAKQQASTEGLPRLPLARC